MTNKVFFSWKRLLYLYWKNANHRIYLYKMLLLSIELYENFHRNEKKNLHYKAAKVHIERIPQYRLIVQGSLTRSYISIQRRDYWIIRMRLSNRLLNWHIWRFYSFRAFGQNYGFLHHLPRSRYIDCVGNMII